MNLFILFVLFFPILFGCEYQDTPFNYEPQAIDALVISNDRQKEIIYKKFKEYESSFPLAVNLEPHEVKNIERITFIDVREPREYKVSMLKNAISKKEFLLRKEDFRGDRLIVYCTIGYRSGIFTQELMEDGFEAYNLLGGVLLWSHYGYDFFRNDLKTNTVHIYSPEWSHLHSNYQAIY